MPRGMENPPRPKKDEEIEDAHFTEIIGPERQLTYQPLQPENSDETSPAESGDSHKERIVTLRNSIRELERLAKISGGAQFDSQIVNLENELRTEEEAERVSREKPEIEADIQKIRGEIESMEELAKRKPELEDSLLKLEQELREKESLLRGDKGISNVHGVDAINGSNESLDKESLIFNASTLEELYIALDSIGSITGSSETFTSEQLKEKIGRVAAGTADSTIITSTHGLRSKVEELLAAKGRNSENKEDTKIEKVRNLLQPEREAMEVAESAYLEAYTEFYSQKGAKEGKEPESLVALKKTHDGARIAYSKSLTNTAEQRLLDKYSSEMPGAERVLSTHRKKILERYNKLVTYNEVIQPAAKKRYQARLEGLDAREKGMVMKGLAWFGEQNKKLEASRGKTGARIIRAVATTAIAGGIGVATGALASVGLVGAAGWGAFRIGKALANSFAAAGIGAGTGEVAGFFLRRSQKKAEKKLTTVGRTGKTLTIDDLEKYDTERLAFEKTADERTVQNRKMIARALGAFIGGAGLSAFENLAELSTGAHEIVQGETTETSSKVELPGQKVSVEQAVSASSIKPATGAPESLSIKGNINNADDLLGHFKDQLAANPEFAKLPSVQALIQHGHTHDELTKWLHLQDSGSVVVHEGDTVSFEGGKIVFHHAGDTGAGQVLVDEKGVPTSREKLDDYFSYKANSPEPRAETVSATQHAQEKNNVPPQSPAGNAEAQPENLHAANPIDGEASQPAGAIDLPNKPLGYESTSPENTTGYTRLGQFVGKETDVLEVSNSVTTPITGTGSGPGVTNLRDFIGTPLTPSTETLLNTHSVPVHTDIPTKYTWSIPGSDQKLPIAFGGNTAASSNLAQAYVEKHPGSAMAFVKEERNILGILTRHLEEWKSNANGVPELVTKVLDAEGKVVPVPKVDKLINEFTGVITD